MKLAWLTDIHLNFLDKAKRGQFYQSIQPDVDAVVISGDIAEALSISSILEEMAAAINKPIYFVLGNHDYYKGNINQVRDWMKQLTQSNPNLFWLGCCEPVKLNRETFLIGEDGWADGRYGDYAKSEVELNDSRLIGDLLQSKTQGKNALLEKMQQLADEDAAHLSAKLTLVARENPHQVIVVTHVPPFKETARHEGQVSNDDYLPFFSSKATGDVLLKFAQEYPLINLQVLCGHTHEAYECQPLKNLTISVGKAEYYQPSMSKVIECATNFMTTASAAITTRFNDVRASNTSTQEVPTQEKQTHKLVISKSMI